MKEKERDSAGWAWEIGEIQEQAKATQAQIAILREENALLIRCIMELSTVVYA